MSSLGKPRESPLGKSFGRYFAELANGVIRVLHFQPGCRLRMPTVGKEEDYFSLGDVFFCITDIVTSVQDSFYGAINFFVQLWTEFYIQLTTISWLSVRTDNRDWTTTREDAKAEQPWGLSLSTLTEGLLERLSFPLGRGDPGEDLVQRDGVVVSRADEWVRRAEELARNNTRARAKLALTSVIRRSLVNKSEEVVQEKEEDDEEGDWGFSVLFSWVSGSASEENPDGPNIVEIEPQVPPVHPTEEHLELFYIGSTLLLLFMIYHIVHKHLSYSRKKAVFLQNISK